MQTKESNINFGLNIIIIIILGNLFLGVGFQNILVLGYPINEISLLFFLIITRFLPDLIKINSILNITPYLIWLFYGGIFVFFSFLDKGIWALRDASHVIDSLYLILGYVMITNDKSLKFLSKIFKFSFILGFIYILFLPIKDLLINITPNIISYAGNNFSLLFNYFSLKITWCWLGFFSYVLLYEKKNINLFYKLSPIVFIGASIFLFQSRSIYFATIAVLIFLMIYGKISKKIGQYIIITIILLFLISFLSLEIKGRISSISFGFYLDHMLSAIPGIAKTNPSLEGPAGSAALRYFWWNQIIIDSLSNAKVFFLGKGFGMPLTDFSHSLGIIVREPHNSYISIFARQGFIGLILWLWMHIVFFKTWARHYKFALEKNLNEKYILLFLMIYIILVLITSVGGSVLLYPCFAIPYYFFWGVILKICFNLNIMKNQKING